MIHTHTNTHTHTQTHKHTYPSSNSGVSLTQVVIEKVDRHVTSTSGSKFGCTKLRNWSMSCMSPRSPTSKRRDDSGKYSFAFLLISWRLLSNSSRCVIIDRASRSKVERRFVRIPRRTLDVAHNDTEISWCTDNEVIFLAHANVAGIDLRCAWNNKKNPQH